MLCNLHKMTKISKLTLLLRPKNESTIFIMIIVLVYIHKNFGFFTKHFNLFLNFNYLDWGGETLKSFYLLTKRNKDSCYSKF